MTEICTLLVKLHIICSTPECKELINLHARPSIIQVGCLTCCYQVCALDHAEWGTADQDYPSEPCHRNVITFYMIPPYWNGTSICNPPSSGHWNQEPAELTESNSIDDLWPFLLTWFNSNPSMDK